MESTALRPFSAPFKTRLEQIAAHVSTAHHHDYTLSFDALQDTLLALFSDCKTASNQTPHVSGFVDKFEKAVSRLQSLRVNTQDFEVVKTIATGAVGRVCLVIGKSDRKVYAMKVLKKTDLLTRREAGFFMEERNALVFAQDSRWITTLYAAFQDDDNLYLIMEYVSGGSLRNLLNNRETTMSESEAKFYVAEMILALEEVHRFNYIHRDLKPDNVLIDHTGHLKLGDFGSCIRIGGESAMIISHETVGTPDYISPEILRAQEGNASYGKEVDLWSLGIILYEMLFDEVPFYSESLVETYARIMDHEKSLEFPSDVEVTSEALDFIKKLICNAETRLGRNSGVQELKNHAWFKGFNWENVLSSQPPFVPELSGPQDTRYFSEDDCIEAKKFAKKPLPKTRDFAGHNLPFIGYSYVQDATPHINFPFNKDENTSTSNKSLSNMASMNTSDLYMAKEQIASLTAAQTAGQLKYQELQKSLEKMQDEKKRLELDLKRSYSIAAQDSAEKEELQLRLNSLRKKQNDADSDLKMKLRVVEEERDGLTDECQALNTKVLELKKKLEQQEDSILELGKAKSFLEKEIERLTAKISEEKLAKNSMHLKVEDTSRKLDRESRHRASSDLERGQLVRKCQELEEKVSALTTSLSEETEKSKILSASAYDLERMKVVLESDLKSARLQLESQSQPEPTKNEDANNDLQNQVTALTAHREKFLSELAAMTKANAILELEVTEINEKLAKEAKEHSKTKSLLNSVESKLSKQSLRILELEQLQSTLENRISIVKQEHEREINALQSTITSLSDANLKSEAARASLESELQHTKFKLSKAEEVSAQLTEKNSDLQKSISEERRSHSTTESKLKTFEHQLAESTELVTSLQHQIKLENLAHTEEVVELQIRNAKLEQKQDHHHHQQYNAHDIEVLDEKNKQNTLTIQRLEHEVKTKNAHIVELETHRSLDNVQRITLQDRVNELEIWTLSLQEELDQTKAKLMKTLDPAAASIMMASKTPQPMESKAEKHRLGLKNLFFRSQQQKLEQEKAYQRLNEAENDIRGSDDGGFHVRQKSAGSSHSLFSHLTKQSEASLCFDFDTTYILKGFLKTPKDGKVKRGWKQKYAVLRDFKVYMYDREREADTHEGTLVADLQSQVFVVKPVPQNELIHTTARQIECIFKIQCSSKGISQNNPQTSSTTIDLAKAIEKLQQDIKHEEMMQNAVERMANAAPEEGQKQAFYQQLETSHKKISKMICELQTMGDQLNAIQVENPTLDLDEVSSQSFEEEVSQAKGLLQNNIEEEIRKRDNLKKLVSATIPNKSSDATTATTATTTAPILTPSGKSLKDEILSLEMSIQKLQADLISLNGNDTVLKRSIVRKTNNNQNRHHGHHFKKRQNYQSNQPMACAHCQDALWGNQSLECTRCRIQCHNSCHKLVEVSCSEVNALKEIPPLYFMAESAQERIRWISALEYFRNEIKKPSQPPPPASSSSATTSRSNSITNILTSSPSHTPPTPINHHMRNVSGTSSTNWYKRMSYQAESPKSMASQSEASLASFHKSSSSTSTSGAVGGKRMSFQVESLKGHGSKLVHQSDATIHMSSGGGGSSSGFSTPRAAATAATAIAASSSQLSNFERQKINK
ncbi:hypothetical protein BDR26DRAFT_822951, partial [Obelidium mucronatum]